MKSIEHEELTLETFEPYGFYADMLSPKGRSIETDAFVFYRDMARLNLGQATQASFSVCQVRRRECIVDALEYHDGTAELLMPLDGDVLMQIGHATHTGEPPLDELRVFRVPRGTLVCLHPGVWHHAPYCCDSEPVNILVALPERTYARDTVGYEVPVELRAMIKSRIAHSESR